jgi:hypothetical protein
VFRASFSLQWLAIQATIFLVLVFVYLLSFGPACRVVEQSSAGFDSKLAHVFHSAFGPAAAICSNLPPKAKQGYYSYLRLWLDEPRFIDDHGADMVVRIAGNSTFVGD